MKFLSIIGGVILFLVVYATNQKLAGLLVLSGLIYMAYEVFKGG